MDTSETYIKMCKKAEEIQKNHKWEYGDWLVAEHGVFQIGTATFGYDMTNPNIPPIRSQLPIATCQAKDATEAEIFSGELIWLPRQDQLQEMVGKDIYTNIKNAMFSILDDLHKYAFTPNVFNEFIPTTMEQLWLAFVMKERFNKAWNGEDWAVSE